LAQTCEDRDNLLRVYGVKANVVHEQATDPSEGIIRYFNHDSTLKLVWAGRYTELKGIPLLLRALKKLDSNSRIELHLAGDGPNTESGNYLPSNLVSMVHVSGMDGFRRKIQ